jgi:transketolase
VYEAFFAALELEKMGISAEVLNVSSIRPLHRREIAESISKTRTVVTAEEHSLHGGLGSLISEVIAEQQLPARIVRLGISRGQFSKAGPRAEIRAYYGIDQKGIVRSAAELLRGQHEERKVEDERAATL